MRKRVNVTWRSTSRGVVTEEVWLVDGDEEVATQQTGARISLDGGQSAMKVDDILKAAEDFVMFEDDEGIFGLEAVCILSIEDV